MFNEVYDDDDYRRKVTRVVNTLAQALQIYTH